MSIENISEPKRVLLSGYYGFDNYGDELILETLTTHLKKHRIEPLVLSAAPEKTSNSLGVEAAGRMNPIAILSALSSTDALISGGGGLFQDTTSIKSPIYYGGLIQLAKWTHKPVAIVGQGLGPLKTKTGIEWAVHALENANMVLLRDTASVDWAKTHANVEASLMADTVWAHPAGRGEMNASASAEPREGLAISLRPHPSLNADFIQSLVDSIAKTFSDADKHQPIRLLNCQANEDTEPLTALKSALEKAHFSSIETLSGLHEITCAIQASAQCIAMRFHVVLMALKLQTPCFALAYDPKVTYLAQRTQLPFYELQPLQAEQALSLALDFKTVSPEAIQEQVTSAQAALDKLTQWIMAL